MPNTYEGNLIATGLRFGIVVSRFNETITRRMLSSCLDCLERHGGKEEDMEVAWVPGTFEVPQAARRMAESGKYQAVICLAALIRGETPHFDILAAEAVRGIARIGHDTAVPTVFGVITAESLEQALERAGARRGNRGWDAALTAIEMANLAKVLPPPGPKK